MSYIFKETFEIRVAKKEVEIFLAFHMIFKIFFQNYSQSIITAHQSLAKRFLCREQGLGESSGFSRLKLPRFRHFLLHKLSDLHLKTW